MGARLHIRATTAIERITTALLAIAALTLLVGMPRWDNTRKQFVAGNDLGFGASGNTVLPSQTITASGQTAWFSGTDINTLNLLLVIAGATGTAPTFQLIVETDDGAGGNVQTLFTFATQSGAQAGLRKGGITGIDQRWRLRWVVGGTTPSFTGVTVTGEAK